MDSGEQVASTFRRRLALASRHVAMFDVGFGFQLVPWTPPIVKRLPGAARGDGSDDWILGGKRS
ncbi:hypothetical protein AL346_10870 [Chelatococcus sp. CO-6]|nr:hypothetical protein AL346_10870 [Chelatococcus sp. CO-6]